MTDDRPTHAAAGSVPPAHLETGGRPARAALPPVVRRPVGVVALLGVLLVAAPVPFYAGDSGPGRFDRWVMPAVDGTLSSSRTAALLVDSIGELIGRTLVVAALALLCLGLGRHRLAVSALAGSVLTSVATTALKPVVDHRIHGEFLSYPSGHTAVSTAVGVVVALLLVDLLGTGRLPGTLIVLALAGTAGAAMAWAQVSLGAHYPTDTLGGFGCGLAVVPATAWLVDRVAVTGLRR